MKDSHQRKLILGSSSRYRSELLSRLRIPFEIITPDIDETPHSLESPKQLACRLAMNKARKIAGQFPSAVVIGADQVADLNGESLNKPGTHEKATAQLRLMSGKVVIFQTAVAVVCEEMGFAQMDLAQVKVTFDLLSDHRIEAYLNAEQPYDCAGSSKSEGLGIALLSSIESDDPTALIGLPLIRVHRMLQATGLSILPE